MPEKRVETESLPEKEVETEDQRIEMSKEGSESSPVPEATDVSDLPEANEEQETRNGASISDEFNALLKESDEEMECLSFSKWSVCCFPVPAPSTERSPDGRCCVLSILSFRAVARSGRGKCGMQWWLSTN